MDFLILLIFLVKSSLLGFKKMSSLKWVGVRFFFYLFQTIFFVFTHLLFYYFFLISYIINIYIFSWPLFFVEVINVVIFFSMLWVIYEYFMVCLCNNKPSNIKPHYYFCSAKYTPLRLARHLFLTNYNNICLNFLH